MDSLEKARFLALLKQSSNTLSSIKNVTTSKEIPIKVRDVVLAHTRHVARALLREAREAKEAVHKPGSQSFHGVDASQTGDGKTRRGARWALPVHELNLSQALFSEWVFGGRRGGSFAHDHTKTQRSLPPNTHFLQRGALPKCRLDAAPAQNHAAQRAPGRGAGARVARRRLDREEYAEFGQFDGCRCP